MRVETVPLEWVNVVWPKVESFFAEAVKHGDDYSVEHLKVLATQGNWLLLIAVTGESDIHGAMLINFFNRPNTRVAFVMVIGGKFIVNKEMFEQLKAIVVSRGATEIEGTVRGSVARLLRQNLGFKEKHRIVGVKLC
jgi:hypothetical protein